MATKEKIRRLSRVKPAETDSVQVAKRRFGDHGRAIDVLMEAQRYWDNMAYFRYERKRNKDYCYGKQWDDIIVVDGEHITEAEYIRRQGSVPLKNNLIRRLVRSVLGEYYKQNTEPTCFARDRKEQVYAECNTELLGYNADVNDLEVNESRSFEDFLIGGFIVNRIRYGWDEEGNKDVWVNHVDCDNFFVDSNMRDFNAKDVSCLGEIHDISIGTLLHRFAKSPADHQRLKEIYGAAADRSYLGDYYEQFGYDNRRLAWDFLFPDNGRCRVIEVWRKEQKPRIRCHDMNTGELFKIEIEDYHEMVEVVNARRLAQAREAGIPDEDVPLIDAGQFSSDDDTGWFMDNYWYRYMLSPFGDILEEGETPYDHKSHPYVLKAYPFIDGEIHSFVNDVIDQQRYVNRLITMYDWIMRASAKGVLLVPEDCLGNVSLRDVAETWSSFNGVLALKMKPGAPMPQQISANAVNIGIGELLNIQLKFFEDISGVHGALQGRSGNSGESGTLYAQQAQNASTSLLDLLMVFSSFRKQVAYKTLKDILQYYDDKRIMEIVGYRPGVEITPDRIRNVKTDIRIVESSSSPAYRQFANEFLMQIWSAGQITLEQLLENGSFPFADKLLQSLQANQQAMQEGQPVQGIDPALIQQAQQGVDMNAVNRGYDMLMNASRQAA